MDLVAFFDLLGNNLALSIVVFFPLLGALALLLIPKANEAIIKLVSLGTSVFVFLVSLVMLYLFDFSKAETFQLGGKLSWIDSINSYYETGVDGISLPLLVLSTFITMLSIIYSLEHLPEPKNPKGLFALILILETGMNGTFVALDLILFFVFFELVLLPMYFMIGIWGDNKKISVSGIKREVETRLYASIKFFIFTLFGSAFMLLGFLGLYYRGGKTFSIPELIILGSNNAFTGTFATLVFAALIPMGVNVAIPSITKPMCPTEENAINLFRSVCARHAKDPYIIPIAARIAIAGAHSLACCGSIGIAILTNPYDPSLRRIAARITDPTVGAAV